MKTKVIVSSLAIIGVIGIGVGYAESEGLLPSRFDIPHNLTKTLSSNTSPQNLTATTTVPGTLSGEQPTPQPTPIQVQPKTYGPLIHTYTDTSTGFSISYPDGMEIQNGGDIELIDTASNGKSFALKLCSPNSLCGSTSPNTVVQSLSDLTNTQVSSSNGKKLTETHTSLSVVDTSSGVKLSRYQVAPTIQDSSGRDVTAQECDECSGLHVEYVGYKSPKNYVKLIPIGEQTINSAILKQVINSIKY